MMIRMYRLHAKTALLILTIALLSGCAKDQNAFLPYTRINLRIPLANYNHLRVPGNSILFKDQGFKGVIVVCINPELGLYGAYDACCPNETDYSGVLRIDPVAGLNSPSTQVYSSSFYGTCAKCGSKFNLLGGGRPDSGPAKKYLQSYSISSGSDVLIVSN